MPIRKDTKKKKKTSFVPRVVYATAVVGAAAVIPLCVTACGGKVEGQPQPSYVTVAASFADSGPTQVGSVAAAFADSGPIYSVAEIGFDSGPGVADTGFAVADSGFTVATVGFEAGDAPFGVADASFGVGSVGFEGGKPGDAGEG